MFKYNQQDQKWINIENGPRCTLMCPACKRTHWIRDYGKPPKGPDITPDHMRKLLKYFTRTVNFCGQVSDPIFGKHFIELLQICHEHNRPIHIATAATGRSMEWYKKAFKAAPNAEWQFGIDGPPHLSFLHRVNQDGEFLFEVMKMGKEMGMSVVWQYIIFSYNEDKIDECIELAKKHKISMFFIESTRDAVPHYLFPKKDRHEIKA